MQVIRFVALLVLGAIGFLALVVAAAAPFYRDHFEARRERFLREGTPLTETVIAKVVGNKGKYLVCAAQGTPLPAAGEQPVGKWVRVSPATFAQYQLDDQIELLAIGEEYFVRDSEFYTVLQPIEAAIIFVLAGFSFVLVKKVWKIEPGGAASTPYQV